MNEIGKYLFWSGCAIAVIGFVVWQFGNKPGILGWFGKLPGDIKIEREGFKLYFPITTMLVISLLLNLIVRIFKSK